MEPTGVARGSLGAGEAGDVERSQRGQQDLTESQDYGKAELVYTRSLLALPPLLDFAGRLDFRTLGRSRFHFEQSSVLPQAGRGGN